MNDLLSCDHCRCQIKIQTDRLFYFFWQKYPGLLIGIALVMLTLVVAAEQLRCYMLLREKIFYSDLGWTVVAASRYLALVFVPVFMFGMVCFCRHWRWSEQIILLALVASAVAAADAFGCQNPYIDHRYFDRPMLRFYLSLAQYFFVFVLLCGPGLLFLFFSARGSCGQSRTRLRRILADVSALLFVVFVLWQLADDWYWSC